MIISQELIAQLEQYVESYEETVVVAYNEAHDMKEKMLLYVSAKIIIERYG